MRSDWLAPRARAEIKSVCVCLLAIVLLKKFRLVSVKLDDDGRVGSPTTPPPAYDEEAMWEEGDLSL